MFPTRVVCRLATIACVVLAMCQTARAQSPLDGFDPGANNLINALVVQPDGKIVVAGAFTTLGGGGVGTTTRNGIGRLNADGSLDTTFDSSVDGTVFALARQPDGKILVGGNFTTLAGHSRSYIGRLDPDGSIDSEFHPGADNQVHSIAVQPDGKILVGGNFSMLGGGGTGTTPRNRIGRLEARNGSVDLTFDPGANASVSALTLQPDRKIVVGGLFTMLGGGGSGLTARRRIGRLNGDGSLDVSFDPGADGGVNALAVQPDGKILVGGLFNGLGGGTGTSFHKSMRRVRWTPATIPGRTRS
jgi:uncharacterized delta-60 repeat protein